MPRISVVIPTYNRASLLRKAIASVLRQQDADFELIVSDNCSTDGTAQVVAEFAGNPRLVASRNDRNLGMVGNWRRGIVELASCEWFLLMSDDDYLTDDSYLARASEAIDRHRPKFVYAGGVVHDTVNNLKETLRPPFDGPTSGEAVFASRGTVKPQDIMLCTMLFRRDDALRLGFFDDPSNLCCDSKLYLMLCAEGDAVVMPDPVAVYVKHGSNLVDTIVSSRRLITHALDYTVVPYAYALSKGMSRQAIKAFRHNVRLDRQVMSTLLRLRVHDTAWFVHCRARIAAQAPTLLAEVESSLAYRSAKAATGLLKRPLRRRYPMTDDAPPARTP